jgi:molybdenum cofactor synthesis domain-containing protein
MSEEKTVRAALVIIGNEILSGRTQDANLQHLAKELNGVGVTLSEARVIPDDEEMIVGTVNEMRAAYDYVFTTGGIGPTHDDITSECVAKAFGLPLIRNAEAQALMEAHYARTGRELNESRLRMANTPEGAALVKNPISTAPGFRVENVYVLAGVPMVMQAMLEGLKPELVGGETMLSRAVASYIGEGNMAAGLAALQDKYSALDIGSYPFYKAGNRFGTTIVLRHTDGDLLDEAVQEVAALMTSLGGEPEFQDMSDG